MKRLSRPAWLTVSAAITLALAGGAYAGYTAIPSNDGTISGCVDEHTGVLRVVDFDAGNTCSKHENRIEWNQRGPAGVSGYEIVAADGSSNEAGVAIGSHQGNAVDAQQTQTATAYCPPGKKVTGGGVDVSFAPGITVNASHPQNPPGQTGPSARDGGWTGIATIDPYLAGRLWNINVWAFCAAVTP
jgi:hypothetical protein